MYSTPIKTNSYGNTRAQLGMAVDQLEITGNSVVITPPADTISSFDPLASKMAPLAQFECSINSPGQSTVGHYWKTFDEDDVNSPGSGLDESSSESSDDENFSGNHVGKDAVQAKERNGWINLPQNTPNGIAKHDGIAHAGELGTSALKQNGTVHDDLKTLPSSNNNQIGSSSCAANTRTAIQTDF